MQDVSRLRKELCEMKAQVSSLKSKEEEKQAKASPSKNEPDMEDIRMLQMALQFEEQEKR